MVGIVPQGASDKCSDLCITVNREEHVAHTITEPVLADIELAANQRNNCVSRFVSANFIVCNSTAFYTKSVCEFLLS